MDKSFRESLIRLIGLMVFNFFIISLPYKISIAFLEIVISKTNISNCKLISKTLIFRTIN